MMIRNRVALLTAFLVVGVQGWCQNFSIVPGSTEPRIELAGEHFQIYSNGIYFTAPLPAQTMSRYGVFGADLGYPVIYPDKIVFLFGDTMAVSAAPNMPGGFPGQQGPKGRRPGGMPPGNAPGPFFNRPSDPDAPNDSIGFIPNMDLS